MQLICSYFFFGIGVFFILISSLGLMRFNADKLMKVHAIGITDALGIPVICVGLLIKSFTFMLLMKVFFLILLLWVTSATSTYIAVRIVYHDH